jgi:hypothetical protein
MEIPADSEELQRRISRTFEMDRMVRSHIIYETTAIEGVVDSIISWHFCPDENKHIWFQSLLFRDGEISFSKKIIILQKILKEFYPDLNKSVKGLTKKLDDIRMLRNKFAHSELMLDEDKIKEADDKGVFLKSIKDGKVIEEFIPLELAEKVVNDNTIFNLIMVCILFEVQNRVQGKEEAGALLKLLEQLTDRFPEVLARVK